MCKILPLFLILFIASSSVQAQAAYEKEVSLRGLEKAESRFLDPLGTAVSGVTYIPRKAVDGSLYLTGRMAAELSDPDFIRRVKDILYFYDEKFMWYPIVDYASGFRAAYGAGLNFKHKSWRVNSRAVLHDSNYYSYSSKIKYSRNLGSLDWDTALLAVAEKKDDRRFYGIGADPRRDSRNTFVGENDYGIYTENRKKLQWESSLYNADHSLGISYLGYYQRRQFDDHGSGANDVREVFDHSRIPGFDAPVRQIYNELALDLDTRNQKKILSPGFKSEVYSGISAGLGKHNANLLRTGFDAAGFIPVIRENRLLIPRLSADLVENLNEVEIPFSEYSRQLNFRGTSGREIIRSERISMVPSIEYQFPLSHIFSANIFYDTLFVGPRVGSIRWNEGLWAAGAGLNFHYLKHELARIELAGGSEGFQVRITVGAPLKTNHRKDW